jgi:uncharacterized protein (DUF2062 family)
MAILKRRKPRGVFKKFREGIWPSMGWSRAFHYYRHRLFRTGDSTYRITAGLATGVAISFSPFLGTHFFQAMFITWLIRANVIAGFVGTVWGNPWTFPFIFMISYKTGYYVCSLLGLSGVVPLPEHFNFAYFLESPTGFMSYLFSHPLNVLFPMTVGGYLCALLCWPLAYIVLYKPVHVARKAYRLNRMRRYKKSRK